MNQPFPIKPAIKSIIRPDRCEVCKHSFPNPQQVGTFECRRMPPTIAVFKFNHPTNPNIVEFKEYTTFPKVKPDHYCGEARPRIEGLS